MRGNACGCICIRQRCSAKLAQRRQHQIHALGCVVILGPTAAGVKVSAAAALVKLLTELLTITE